MFFVVVGIRGLIGWPSWTQDLENSVPGLSLLFIFGGIVLLPFTTGLVDVRFIVIPCLLIAAAAVIVLGRSRSSGTK